MPERSASDPQPQRTPKDVGGSEHVEEEQPGRSASSTTSIALWVFIALFVLAVVIAIVGALFDLFG